MSSVLTETTSRAGASSEVVANDFSLQVATANGSGSQTANSVLMRSIFRMGVPVSGKNLFPSNIQGLPTWFTIRANRDGYIARKRDLDVLVCMNPETADEDVRDVRAGAHVVYEKKLGLESPGKKRDDVTYYAVPFSELVVKITSAPEHAKLRKLIVNMIYVGVVADLMGIDPAEIDKAIAKQLKGKPKAVDLNVSAVKVGTRVRRAELPGQDPVPRRAHARDGGQGHRRGQHGIRPRLRLRAAPPSARGIPSRRRPPSASPSSTSRTSSASIPSREEERRRHPGRGRDRLDRHGARRRVGGRAVVYVHVRPGHLAHVGVHRARLLRRNPRGHLRHPAHRAFHRPPDAHDAGGHPPLLLQLARRLEAPAPLPRFARRVLHDGPAGLRPRRAAPDARVRDVGPRPRNEQLDGGPVPVSHRAPPPRQGARRRRHREGEGVLGPVQGRGRRRHPLSDPPRHARARTPRTSREAPVTTKGLSTRRSRRTTSTT